MSDLDPATIDAELARLEARRADLLRAKALSGSGASGVPSTVYRQRAKQLRFAPAISRTSKARVDDAGRRYGELPAGSADQRQADAGRWAVGRVVRQQLHPLAIAVDGEVRRVYEVTGWTQDSDEPRTWHATLGGTLSNADLDRVWPDYPLRIGDELPTRQGGAYRPVAF